MQGKVAKRQQKAFLDGLVTTQSHPLRVVDLQAVNRAVAADRLRNSTRQLHIVTGDRSVIGIRGIRKDQSGYSNLIDRTRRNRIDAVLETRNIAVKHPRRHHDPPARIIIKLRGRIKLLIELQLAAARRRYKDPTIVLDLLIGHDQVTAVRGQNGVDRPIVDDPSAGQRGIGNTRNAAIGPVDRPEIQDGRLAKALR